MKLAVMKAELKLSLDHEEDQPPSNKYAESSLKRKTKRYFNTLEPRF